MSFRARSATTAFVAVVLALALSAPASANDDSTTEVVEQASEPVNTEGVEPAPAEEIVVAEPAPVDEIVEAVTEVAVEAPSVAEEVATEVAPDPAPISGEAVVTETTTDPVPTDDVSEQTSELVADPYVPPAESPEEGDDLPMATIWIAWWTAPWDDDLWYVASADSASELATTVDSFECGQEFSLREYPYGTAEEQYRTDGLSADGVLQPGEDDGWLLAEEFASSPACPPEKFAPAATAVQVCTASGAAAEVTLDNSLSNVWVAFEIFVTHEEIRESRTWVDMEPGSVAEPFSIGTGDEFDPPLAVGDVVEVMTYVINYDDPYNVTVTEVVLATVTIGACGEVPPTPVTPPVQLPAFVPPSPTAAVPVITAPAYTG